MAIVKTISTGLGFSKKIELSMRRYTPLPIYVSRKLKCLHIRSLNLNSTTMNKIIKGGNIKTVLIKNMKSALFPTQVIFYTPFLSGNNSFRLVPFKYVKRIIVAMMTTNMAFMLIVRKQAGLITFLVSTKQDLQRDINFNLNYFIPNS